MIKFNKITLPLFFLIFSYLAGAQTDSTGQDQDSLNRVLLQDYNKKIEEIEKQRIEDSLKKAELEAQLNSLKTTDNLKKEELQKQLQELNDKEASRIAHKKEQIDSLRQTAVGFPVTGFFDDTLFLIYSRLGSFSAMDRAEAISNRINRLGDKLSFNPDSLQLAESESTVDIFMDENILMSVSEDDALWNNKDKMELASEYRQIIADKVSQYRSEISFSTMAKRVGLALLVLAMLAAMVYFSGRLFRWTARKIEQQEGKRIRGIKIRNYTLFDSKKEVKALLSVNIVLKWLFILLLIYITLPILFGIFPWTENFADTLFGYILNPVRKIAFGFWHYLPNLITIIVIIIIFYYALKGVRFLKSEVEKGALHIPGFYPDWANPTYQIIKVIIFAFMLVVIFPYLPGSDSPIFKGVSVFLGFLFTFGSMGSLSNIVAGIVLTYMRLFKEGDRVKIGEVMGDIIEKSLLVTRIRTPKNEIISIPNSTVMSSHTINYSSDAPEKGLIIHTTVTIGYDVPWKKMHKALIDAALRTELILPEPKPFVLQTSLEDFYVAYQINAHTKDPNKQAKIYSDLHQNIQDVCNEEGIEILSPHYRAARDGNMSTIPAEYLPKEYKAPGFNFNMDKEEK